MDNNHDTVLRIDGEMTIYRAAELKQTLLAAIENRPALVLDLAGVTEFDSTGVQLLSMAKRAATGLGREFRLQAQSEPVAEVLDLLDLAGHFGDQIVVPQRNGRSSSKPGTKEAHGS